jgi:arylsulfatase A-like enzyme
MRRERSRAPFFLFLNYFDAHAPYASPPAFPRRLAGAEPDRTADTVLAYDGAIAFVDAELENLFAQMREMGVFDSTLIIITSDHGELFGEHGLRQHANGLYEPLLHVPLIVKFPGQRRGLRVERRTAMFDIPRIVRGVVDSGHGAEESIRALGPDAPGVLAEFWIPTGLHRRDPSRYPDPFIRALYDGSWKLIQGSTGNDELYDLATDPGETRNLLAGYDAAALARRRAMVQGAPPLPTFAARADTVKPDEAVLEDLRALGYLH